MIKVKETINRIKNNAISILPSKNSKIQNGIFIACVLLFFAYCFSIPTFSNNKPFNYVSIGICALMCVGMLYYAYRYGKIKINFLLALLIVFNICVVITHLLNGNILEIPKTIILMTIVAFCIYQFACSYSHREALIYVILLAGIAFAVVYIIHYRSDLFDLSKIFDSRLGLDFDNENEISKEFGFFCAASIAIALKNKKVLVKIASYFLVLLFLFLILSTGSISNLLTTVLVCLITAIICQPTIKRKLIIGGTFIGIIGLFVIFLQFPFMSYFKTRIENIFNALIGLDKTNIDNSAYSRLQAALTAFRVGLEKPIFGFGYMSGTDYTNANIQAHNNFAELFIDFGLIGLIIYESLVILPLWKGYKHKEKSFIVAITLYMLIFQFFLTTYYKKFEYIFFALIYGILDESLGFKYTVWMSKDLKSKKNLPTIFEVIPSLTPIGGAEQFVVSFTESVSSQYKSKVNIKLIILYNQNDSRLLDSLKNNGIDYVELGKKSGFDICCACRFRDIVLQYSPDVIHTHLFSLTTLKIAFPFKKKHTKFIHTIHHNLSSSKKDNKFLQLLTKKDYITPVCVAKKPSEEYSNLLGKDVAFINNGIDISKFNNTNPLFERKIDFLCVGRFVQVKNQKFLIGLYSKYNNLQQYSLVFLGDGHLLEECKKMVENNDLSESIKFEGVVDNVNEYMSNSKVLVMPSLNEGNPMVINEAFASGMAVIGNDVGGIHDLLENAELGGLANINNPREFSDKMINALETINSGKISSILYNDDFDINCTVDEYMNLFGILKNDI